MAKQTKNQPAVQVFCATTSIPISLDGDGNEIAFSAVQYDAEIPLVQDVLRAFDRIFDRDLRRLDLFPDSVRRATRIPIRKRAHIRIAMLRLEDARQQNILGAGDRKDIEDGIYGAISDCARILMEVDSRTACGEVVQITDNARLKGRKGYVFSESTHAVRLCNEIVNAVRGRRSVESFELRFLRRSAVTITLQGAARLRVRAADAAMDIEGRLLRHSKDQNRVTIHGDTEKGSIQIEVHFEGRIYDQILQIYAQDSIHVFSLEPVVSPVRTSTKQEYVIARVAPPRRGRLALTGKA